MQSLSTNAMRHYSTVLQENTINQPQTRRGLCVCVLWKTQWGRVRGHVTYLSHMFSLQWAGSYLSLASPGGGHEWRVDVNQPQLSSPWKTISDMFILLVLLSHCGVTTGHLSCGYRWKWVSSNVRSSLNRYQYVTIGMSTRKQKYGRIWSGQLVYSSLCYYDTIIGLNVKIWPPPFNYVENHWFLLLFGGLNIKTSGHA